MCTFMPYPETLGAQLASRWTARRQVDQLMKKDRELKNRFVRGVRNVFGRSIPWMEPDGIYVWLDNWCFGNSPKGFYYVRYRLTLKIPMSTAYDPPVLIVQKSKLRPDQVEYMERKCRETRDIWERGRNAAE